MAYLGSISFGGLASGLDTQKIVEDLIKVDSRPLIRFESRQTDMTKQRDTYESMKTTQVYIAERIKEIVTGWKQ